jgi:hypothetical protein
MEHVHGLIDALSEPRSLGIIVYYQKQNLIFRSPWLEKGVEPYLGRIKKSIREHQPQEAFDSQKRYH